MWMLGASCPTYMIMWMLGAARPSKLFHSWSSMRFPLLCLLLIAVLVQGAVRVKRYEYNVNVPYSYVKILGYNPVVEWILAFGKLSQNFRYLG
uniref:Dolichyl-P-Glc:Glc(2)Man(9)GlcNAc(2)-PP-dolichol alpha-1,2-glucosyltransferase n=1 Tax=Steinernema glaseri TaxID=37863 RepID=A0A1I7ZIR6_9BILA